MYYKIVNKVTEYAGFKFSHPDSIDPKCWKPDKEHPECHVPNRRFKVGRDMAEFLSSGLERSRFDKVYKILGVSRPSGKFTFPYVEIFNEIVLIFLGNMELDIEDVIEITSKETKELMNAVNVDQ